MTAPAQELNERWWVYQSDQGGDPESTWIMKGPKEDEPDVYANSVATIRFDDLDIAERIVADHNALKGCPDPQTFVEAAKAVLETAENYDRKDYDERGYHGEYVPDDTIDDEALAWLREVKA